MPIGEILVYVSESILLFSYITTNMVVLRVLATLSDFSYSCAAMYIGLDSPGTKPMLFFSLASMSINLLHIWRAVVIYIPVRLDGPLEEIYKNNFSNITPREFMRIKNMGEIRTWKNGDVIIKEEGAAKVVIILNGEADVYSGDGKVATLIAGAVAGEISFLTESKPMASIISVGETLTLELSEQNLTRLENKFPSTHLKFEHIMLKSAKDKLVAQNKRSLIADI